MYVCTYQDFLLIRTPFSKRYDLIQKFRGLEGDSLRYNKPVDFMESGLMQKDKWDCWHIDVPFALNTDEAVPAFVNGSYIGGNHGHHGAVLVYSPAHGKTTVDVGSLWKDEKGIFFTLVRVENEDYLSFISENVGIGIENYEFVTQIVGRLVYCENGENTKEISPQEQNIQDIRRSIRHKNKSITAFVDGNARRVLGGLSCDYAEIYEEYEIINPATVAKSLREARPQGGYLKQPDLADFGEPMISCKITYRIEPDGTVLILFDYKKLMNVRFERFLGVMHQEKLDVYGGGIWRYYPKVVPFTTKEGIFDFSKPTSLVGKPFPKEKALTRKYWRDNGSPCERVVDYFRDKKGNDKLAFASGFLPIYDGAPEVRDRQVFNVINMQYTRKHYPMFLEGDLTEFRGIGYKKYFKPLKNKASYYQISVEDKTYIFADLFVETSLDIPISGQVSLLEKSEDVSFEKVGKVLKIKGNNGFAVFVSEYC